MPTKKPKQPKPRTPSKHLPEPVKVPQPIPDYVREPDPESDPPPLVPPRPSFAKRCRDWLANH